MRTLLLLAALLSALPAAAQNVRPRSRPAAPVAAPEVPAGPTEAELLASATAQLQAARTEVQQLRAVAAQAEIEKAANAELRTRNARLVTIARELLAAHEARYGKTTRFAPFNRARVKFETEMQKTGDAIYQNQADAVPVRTNDVNAAPPAADAPVEPQ
jgi:uncharacterized surface protein with fasciclin (FAS1) repeats